MLGRNDRTIWTVYHRSIQKDKKPFSPFPQSVEIPVTVLANRKVSILESIVAYLKDDIKLSYHDIALLLNRDDRTIWTVYHRAKKKQGVVVHA